MRRRRVAHAARAAACAAVLVAALAARFTYLDVWHEVGTPDWSEAFCWAPDCHPPPGGAKPSPLRWRTCTGPLHHGGSDVPLLALPAIAVLAVVAGAVRRRRGTAVAGLGLACLGFAAWGIHTSFLGHLLETVGEASRAERIHHRAVLVMVLASLCAGGVVWVERRLQRRGEKGAAGIEGGATDGAGAGSEEVRP